MQGQARPGVDFKARQTAQIPRRGPIPLGDTGATAVRIRTVEQRSADIIRPSMMLIFSPAPRRPAIRVILAVKAGLYPLPA